MKVEINCIVLRCVVLRCVALRCVALHCIVLMGGCVKCPDKKQYECVRFNVISVTSWWLGSNFLKKNHYVTFECLLSTHE